VGDFFQIDFRSRKPADPWRGASEERGKATIKITAVAFRADFAVDPFAIERDREPTLFRAKLPPAHLAHMQRLHQIILPTLRRQIEFDIAAELAEFELVIGEEVIFPRHFQIERKLQVADFPRQCPPSRRKAGYLSMSSQC